MDLPFARIGVRLGVCLAWLTAMASGEASAQLSGLFQSVPGTLATYRYQNNGIQTVMLPVDLTVSFSGDNPTSSLSATILNPLIGAAANGSAIYPVADLFPMRVTATSSDGQHFHGDLFGSQYLFDWQFQPASGGQLQLNGHVYWAGGRIEDTTITNALLVPSLAGDYNRDGTLSTADYLLWRKNEGTAIPLANDPLGGTIGAAHYNQWRSQFGQTTGSGSSLSSTIPEPATGWMLIAGMLAMLCSTRLFTTVQYEMSV